MGNIISSASDSNSRHIFNLTSRDVQIYAMLPEKNCQAITSSKYFIGTIGFKTSKTIKFPTNRCTRVTLVSGEVGSISQIPRDCSDMVIEESNNSLKTLRLCTRNMSHISKLQYVVNVDCIEKFEPALKLAENFTGLSEKNMKEPTTTTTPTSSESSPIVLCQDASYSQQEITQLPGQIIESNDDICEDEKVHYLSDVATASSTPQLIPSHIDEISLKYETNEEVSKLGFKKKQLNIPPRSVKIAPCAWVSSSSVFGAASCMATGAISGGLDEYRKQQYQTREAISSFLKTLSDPSIPDVVIEIILSLVGSLPPFWRSLAVRVTRDAAKGTVVGATVGSFVAGGMLGCSSGAAALDAAQNIGAATIMRGVGNGLGVALTTAITSCEVGCYVRKWKRGDIHVQSYKRLASSSVIKGTINASICTLTLLPVAGIILAVCGGIVFNVTDASIGWSDSVALKLFGETAEEVDFESKLAHDKLVLAARETVGISKHEPLDEADLNRRLRRWMLSLHPDKNYSRTHPHFHSIVTAATILINEARDEAADRLERFHMAKPSTYDKKDKISHPNMKGKVIEAKELLPIMDLGL